MAVYSYQIIKTEGPYGSILDFTGDSVDGKNKFIKLGEIDGTSFVYIPDDVEPAKQHVDINFTKVTLTDEQKAALRKQSYAVDLKAELRKQLDISVGDLADIVADQSKLNEFALVLLLRLTADYFGVQKMSDEVKATYQARVMSVLSAIDSGDLLIRGEFDNPDNMITEIAPRYTAMQQKVRQYLTDLAELGLR